MAKRWLLPVLVVAMETGWLMVWSTLVGGWFGLPGGSFFPAPTVFGLIAGGWLLMRTVVRRRWTIGLARAVLGAGAVLAALLAVRMGPLASYGLTDTRWLDVLALALPKTFHRLHPAVAAFPIALYLWWRGIRRARNALSVGDVEGAFRWGTLALAIGLILRATSPTDATNGGVLAAVAVFLFAGFLAVALVQVESMQAESGSRERGTLAVNRHWLGFLIGLVGLMLIVAVSLAQALSFDLVDAIVGPIFSAIQYALLVAVIAVSIPIGYLLEVLLWIVQIIRGNAKPSELPRIDAGAFSAWRETTPGATLSPEVIAIVKWTILGLIAVAILVVLLRSIFRLDDLAPSADVEEERDFIWSWPGLRTILGRWLARWLPRRQVPAAVSAAVSAADVPLEGQTIRAIYRDLLHLGAVLGWPRRPSQTPHEYAAVLGDRLTSVGDALALLTELYARVRYGPPLSDDKMVAQARDALDRIRASNVER